MKRLGAALLLLTPRLAFGCAVCFGGADNAKLGAAFNLGIGMLMAATFGLLGAGIMWVVQIERKRAEADARHFAALAVTEALPR